MKNIFRSLLLGVYLLPSQVAWDFIARIYTPAGTPEAPLFAETATAININVSGTVVNGSGGRLLENSTATLVLYDTAVEEIYFTKSVEVGIDGLFTFVELSPKGVTAIWVFVEYQDVSYFSEYVVLDETEPFLDLPITVYNSSTDWQDLNIDLVHVVIMSDDNILTVQEYYGIRNDTQSTIIFETDGTNLPFVHLPDGFSGFDSLAPDSESASFLPATNGIALPPQDEDVYGVIAVMSVPYKNRFKFVQYFSMPVEELTIVVPDGILITSDQLMDLDDEKLGNKNYHIYVANDVPAGDLIFLISGTFGENPLSGGNDNQYIIISIGVLGCALILIGTYLFIRDKVKNQKQSIQIASMQTNIETQDEENPDAIADAIIQLEDRYRRGELMKNIFEDKRIELKERLKKALKLQRKTRI